jgi:hypothetical protein
MVKNGKSRDLAAARNSLRPLFRAKRSLPFWKQLQSIRQATPATDLSSLCRLVELNDHYPFPGLGQVTPTPNHSIPDVRYRYLRPLSLDKELAIAAARINYHSERVIDSLSSLALINAALTEGSPECEQLIADHLSSFGPSVAWLKKDMLFNVQAHGLPGLVKRFRALVAGRERSAWAILCRFMYDMADPSVDAGISARAWIRYDRRAFDHEWYASIIRHEVIANTFDDQASAMSILRYGSTNIVDLYLHLSKILNFDTEKKINKGRASYISPDAIRAVTTNQSCFELQVSPVYKLGSGAVSDTEIFRAAFFFDDIPEVYAWRSEFSKVVFQNYFPDTAQRLSVSGTYKDAVDRLSTAPDQSPAVMASLARKELELFSSDVVLLNQRFLASAVTAASLGRLADKENLDPTYIAELLTSIEDIHLFTDDKTIESLMLVYRDCAILVFVCREVLYKIKRSQDNELERRLAFMAMFESREDILISLDSMKADYPKSARFVAKICTRTFLERLFLIIGSVKEVLETRIDIVVWNQRNVPEQDDDASEDLDALNRELANLDARSDLDSTRVHVDEEALREWFQETQQPNVSRYIQTVLGEGSSYNRASVLPSISLLERTVPEGEEDVGEESRVGSDILLVAIADAVMRAFASDKAFGLDAYLSRRIRHGTLSGQLMTPVIRALNPLFELGELHNPSTGAVPSSSLQEQVEEWKIGLLEDIDQARREIIQLRSPERPLGLIRATWRTASNAAHLDAMSSRVRTRVMENKGVYDIFSDVYALCWDCLESDLADLRLFMARDFLPRQVNKLIEMFEGLSAAEKRASFMSFGEAQGILASRVQEVCGWFIRPVFRRDSYDLGMLIGSTLSIVRELDVTYYFREEIQLDSAITLTRGSFEVFGDALFVLIGNAAKHGVENGTITVEAKSSEDGTYALVSVRSVCPDTVAFNEGLRRIEEALAPPGRRALDRAAVEEGFSGLRKLAGMVESVRGSEASLFLTSNSDDLSFIFSVNLPIEIYLARDRGLVT